MSEKYIQNKSRFKKSIIADEIVIRGTGTYTNYFLLTRKVDQHATVIMRKTPSCYIKNGNSKALTGQFSLLEFLKSFVKELGTKIKNVKVIHIEISSKKGSHHELLGNDNSIKTILKEFPNAKIASITKENTTPHGGVRKRKQRRT